MTEGNDLELLIGRQHGAVSRVQLREIGLSTNTIESWVRRCRLRRLLHGVYATGPVSLATRVYAAYLWQPQGVVSHLAAAYPVANGDRRAGICASDGTAELRAEVAGAVAAAVSPRYPSHPAQYSRRIARHLHGHSTV
ncbi:MAG: hypothetical protein LC799_24975 [Actinobacteria bacterium]|nr:hypothetical protein [Actinomycetota bacterium]